MDDAATTVQETEQELLAAVDTAALLQKLKRSNSASRLLGLSVLMDAKADNYFVSPENYVGFKVSQEIQLKRFLKESIKNRVLFSAAHNVNNGPFRQLPNGGVNLRITSL